MLALAALTKTFKIIINAENHDTSILIGKEDESTSYELRLNDRVICTKNMYDAERPLKAGEDEPEHCAVYNGDRGVITFISYDKSFIIVKFDLWGEIEIPRSKLSHIELGYALSCHKLQGSEADFVIVGFDSLLRGYLQRNGYTPPLLVQRNIVCLQQKVEH